MGDIITASGTRVYIGAAVVATAADTLGEFTAMTGWTEVGLIESLGEFGDSASDVSFAVLGDGRTRHAKGARDAGSMTITCAHDPADAGQVALEAAEGTNNNYAFKVVIPDAPTEAYSDSIIYFRGLVRSKKKNIGTNDNVVKNTFEVGVNSELFTDPSST